MKGRNVDWDRSEENTNPTSSTKFLATQKRQGLKERKKTHRRVTQSEVADSGCCSISVEIELVSVNCLRDRDERRE